MTTQSLLSKKRQTDLTTFTVLVDGTAIDKARFRFFSMSIHRALNRIPTARLTLLDGSSAARDFKASNAPEFNPGGEVEIKIGYHSEETTLFKGIIIKHGIKVRNQNPSLLILECKDKAVKMTVGRKNGYHTEMTEADVFEALTGNYDLELALDDSVASAAYAHPALVQYFCTDWDFLLSRADANGWFVLADNGTLSVLDPRSLSGEEPVVQVGFGTTMLEFEADLDAREQFAGVSSRTWNFTKQDLVEIQAVEPDAIEQGDLDAASLTDVIGLDSFSLQHGGGLADEELQAWADAQLLKSRLARIKGRLKFQGFEEVQPGRLIDLTGVGNHFSGKAFVSAVSHQVADGNWLTEVQFGLPDNWFEARNDIIDRPAANLLPGAMGLQIGIVTQLKDDPLGEHRIQVKIPSIDNQANGVWTRVATLDAGKQRGTFFRPEIGDEVVVGYLHDDPRDAIVLGMLHSSTKPAPLTETDENHQKGFFSRENMKLLFDDEKKSLLLETPAGKKITLDEEAGLLQVEDENGNKITLDDKGIALNSSGDLKLDAGNGNITINGVKVGIAAQAELKAESSGKAVLKGTMVQIN